jgi:hypothetical protein
MIHKLKKWEDLLHINFNDRVVFLHEPELTTEYVPGFLNFFGALATFTPGKETRWKNQKSIYAALPTIIIQFASDCHVDLGYLLLMCCNCHTFDSRTQSFDDKLAKLIVHQGEVGINLSLATHASMKNSVYFSEML